MCREWRVSSDGGEDEFIKRLRGAEMKDVKMCSLRLRNSWTPLWCCPTDSLLWNFLTDVLIIALTHRHNVSVCSHTHTHTHKSDLHVCDFNLQTDLDRWVCSYKWTHTDTHFNSVCSHTDITLIIFETGNILLVSWWEQLMQDSGVHLIYMSTCVCVCVLLAVT